MTDLAIRVLTRDEALSLTERIRESAEQTWALLIEAHERRAWAVLGYDSWRAYATAEFGMSQSRAYQLLNQARVVTALEEATGSTNVEISEYEARRLKPVLPEVLDELRESVTGLPREEAVAAIRKVVDEVKEREAERLAERRARFAQKAQENPPPPFVPTVPCPTCDGKGRLPKESQ